MRLYRQILSSDFEPDSDVRVLVVFEFGSRVFDEGHTVPHVQRHVHDLLSMVLVYASLVRFSACFSFMILILIIVMILL